MSEETMKHMYERRYRGEEAKSQGFEGTGLGLAHVKSVVVLYNGDIACESAVGRGTTFIVTLPLTTASHTK
ncbi:MAG: HAMP domain-containing histidine kinase [Kiritimatiellae bacterium]|nr:HAMP domain-containing histidine kinase [Kiritimatiellia bacterium]